MTFILPNQLSRSYQVSLADEVLPSEDADKEQDGRDAPGHADHHDHLVARSPGPVLGRDLDRAEPVDGDEQDGELGHQADGVVHRQPQVAQDGAKL